MPEGQTEVERRYLKYGKKPVQMQKRNSFARIPLPASLTLGHLPPGGRYMERYVSARQAEIRTTFVVLADLEQFFSFLLYKSS